MIQTYLTANLAREIEACHLRHCCSQRGHATCDVQLLGGPESAISTSGLLNEKPTITVQFHFRRPRRKLHSKFNALKNSHLQAWWANQKMGAVLVEDFSHVHPRREMNDFQQGLCAAEVSVGLGHRTSRRNMRDDYMTCLAGPRRSRYLSSSPWAQLRMIQGTIQCAYGSFRGCEAGGGGK